jgi:hypothetical protein
MKKLFFLLGAVLLLSSCVTQKMPVVKEVGIVDYKKYWDQGFFITESPSPSFDYIPTGAVTAVLQDGFEIVNNTKNAAPKKTGWASRSRSAAAAAAIKYTDNQTRFTIYDAIDMAVAKAKESGADGLINISFEITTVATAVQVTYGGTTDTDLGYRYAVKGMAIKRR